MTICPRCSREVEGGDRFCPGCGAALDDLSGPTISTPARGSSRASTPNVHGRFEPGTRLGERYRIVGLLGRGGMGEVYRADDLELGQSVALKFLPERVAADPVALDRFRSEVRTARQIAHPNVCRIYDIGQVDGNVFLSMEYIDGEDLSQVLRRMGRPSREKAVEIARQLCFGLAAAHEAGILHRDLKPANVMIDGRGRVRITDFGLAGLIDDLEGEDEHAGTPAYMAPEQLEHGKVSVRSDIYSLGLILYEIFTGQPAYRASTVAELRDLHRSSSVTTPRSVVDEVDPAVERVILRCLERDPAGRPGSVYSVLAALPGGDPLAAALAAGETPSPQLVANAGERGGLSGRAATLLTLWIAAVALLAVLISSTWMMPSEPGVVLATRAAEIVRDLGYEELPENTAWGINPNVPYLEHLLESGDTSWTDLEREMSPGIVFWRRWSPSPLLPTDFHQAFPTFNDPAQTEAGSISVVLDGAGRLVRLDVEPDRNTEPAPGDEQRWHALLDHAGLAQPEIEVTPMSDGTARATDLDDPLDGAGPRRQMPASDETRAWRISAPDALGRNLVVRASTFHGRPVHFLLTGKSLDHTQPDQPNDDRPRSAALAFLMSALDLAKEVLWPLTLIFAVVLAVRNVRAGRGDRQGAMRAGLIMFGFYFVGEVANYRLGEQHITGVLHELIGGRSTGHALLHGCQMWIGYLALEPYVRRLWPHLLVAWVRLISGQWRDPLVGREVLVGLALGALIYLLGPIGADALAQWLGLANFPPVPNWFAAVAFTAPATQVYALCDAATSGLLLVLRLLLFLLVFRMLTGRVWAAIPAAMVIFTIASPRWFFGAFNYPESPLLFTGTAWSLVYAGVIAFALLRFGLVCALAAHVGMSLLWWTVGTTDLRDWYATPMIVMLLALALLVAYGVWTSTAGRPIGAGTDASRLRPA